MTRELDLTISRLATDDTGQYECQVVDMVNETSVHYTVHLDVVPDKYYNDNLQKDAPSLVQGDDKILSII